VFLFLEMHTMEVGERWRNEFCFVLISENGIRGDWRLEGRSISINLRLPVFLFCLLIIAFYLLLFVFFCFFIVVSATSN
jgi:hypothetical protein